MVTSCYAGIIETVIFNLPFFLRFEEDYSSRFSVKCYCGIPKLVFVDLALELCLYFWKFISISPTIFQSRLPSVCLWFDACYAPINASCSKTKNTEFAISPATLVLQQQWVHGMVGYACCLLMLKDRKHRSLSVTCSPPPPPLDQFLVLTQSRNVCALPILLLLLRFV